MDLKQNRFSIFTLGSVFNPKDVVPFDYFSVEHTILLQSFLLENTIELLHNNYPEDQINILLHYEDQNFIPDFLSAGFVRTIYLENYNREFLSSLIHMNFRDNAGKFIFHSRAIGFGASDINKALNLLSSTDDNLVIGKSDNESVSFFAFCNIDEDTISEFCNPKFQFDNFLSAVNRNDHFLNILSNFMLIDDFSSFNKLYHELSKKESETFCSQQMHEKFTHLFIEYKELLK